MIVEQNNIEDQEPSLIEDVIAPHAEQYTDSNREEVRRRSIGHLQQQYQRSRLPKRSLWRKPAKARVSEPIKNFPAPKHQIVRPLQTFPSLYPESPAHNITALSNNAAANMKSSRDWVSNQFDRLKYVLSLGWLSIAGAFRSAGTKIRPKRRFAAAVPVLLALLFLTASIWLGASNSPRTLGGETDNAKTIPIVSTGSNNSGGAGSNSSSGNNSSSAPLPSSDGAAFQQPLGSSYDGSAASNFQVAAPAPTSGALNSVLPTTTSVVIPPASVQVGDKPLLDVSGGGFTIH